MLFDVTYRDGGCFIDLDAVRILRHRDGSFVQPKYDPIVVIRPYVSATQFRYVLRERRTDITNYVRRFHRISTGAEEVRDWCTEDIVARHMQALCHTYRIAAEPTLSNMEQLMSAYLFDLCTAIGDRVTEEAAIGLIRSPTKEYDDMLTVLEEMLLEEVVARENHHPV